MTARSRPSGSPDSPDHYAVLGLRRALSFDPNELRERYFELSRQLHPDRHAGASAEEQTASLRRMSAVNLAYLTLRDPVTRAHYWLGLHGEPLRDRGEALPGDVAAQIMAVRDVIERHATSVVPAEPLRRRLQDAHGEIQLMRRRFLDDLKRCFEQDATAQRSGLRGVLTALACVDKLNVDIEAELRR